MGYPGLVAILTVSPIQKRTTMPAEIWAESVANMLGSTNCSPEGMLSSGNRFNDDAVAR
jgi:hypothetical protein